MNSRKVAAALPRDARYRRAEQLSDMHLCQPVHARLLWAYPALVTVAIDATAIGCDRPGEQVSLFRSGPSRLVWAIALPAMLTNVATALFGLADMWATGRLETPQRRARSSCAKFMMGLLVCFTSCALGRSP
ncbi:MAG: hypothetical protein R3E09_11310 [Novosphingobium sp.]